MLSAAVCVCGKSESMCHAWFGVKPHSRASHRNGVMRVESQPHEERCGRDPAFCLFFFFGNNFRSRCYVRCMCKLLLASRVRPVYDPLTDEARLKMAFSRWHWIAKTAICMRPKSRIRRPPIYRWYAKRAHQQHTTHTAVAYEHNLWHIIWIMLKDNLSLLWMLAKHLLDWWS